MDAETPTDIPTEEQSKKDGLNPNELAKQWGEEIAAAKKYLKDWHTAGREIIAEFLDERDLESTKTKKLNLFTSNVITQESMLYGRPPSGVVTRKFSDHNDDIARVAATILERNVNCDTEKSDDTMREAFGLVLNDRLRPGAGMSRVRYEMGEEDATNEDGDPVLDEETGEPLTQKAWERVDIDWCPWDEVLWSPARARHLLRWISYRAEMSRQDCIEAFGEDIGSQVPLLANRKEGDQDDERTHQTKPWARAEVWEIHDKDTRKVYFYCEGYPSILKVAEEPLPLDGFFPSAPFWMANLTTSKYIPRPDYTLAEDLYESVHQLMTRKELLVDALRVAGMYDKEAGDELGRLLDDTNRNTMIPCDSWGALAEKGGIAGVVQFFPLEQIVAALSVIRDLLREEMDLLFQVTGMSDIIRGQGTQANVTATEQKAKVRFGSTRLQKLQDEFAEYVSATLRLKGELIVKLFDDKTILAAANIDSFTDADKALVPKALEMLRSKWSEYRIEVKPESIALTDFAALQEERTGVIVAISTFVTATGSGGQHPAPADADGSPQVVPGGHQGLERHRGHHRPGHRGDEAAEGPGGPAGASSGPEADCPADEGLPGHAEGPGRAPGGHPAHADRG
jgi:hypothetical protein